MRPTPIPDSLLWEGSQRLVIAAPDGDLTNPDVGAVEAIGEHVHGVAGIPDGTPAYTVRLVPEDGDLEKLQAGGSLLLTFYGAMPIWTVTTHTE